MMEVVSVSSWRAGGVASRLTPPTITAWGCFRALARPLPRSPRRARGSPMGNPPAGRSHWIASPTRRGRQCGGGSTWITLKGLRPEGWPRPFVIDATAASFLLTLHYGGLQERSSFVAGHQDRIAEPASAHV